MARRHKKGRGPIGARGIPGPPGPPGRMGPIGARGTTGATGTAGATGTTGAKGTTGSKGTTGAKGSKGATGRRGAARAGGTAGSIAPSERHEILSGIGEQIENIFRELNVQMKRMANVQAQVDELRRKMQQLMSTPV